MRRTYVLVTSSEASQDSVLGLSIGKLMFSLDLCVLFMCMSVHLCVSMCAMLCLVPPEGQKRGSFPPVTGVIDGCELLCGCWELNLGPL